MTSPPPRPGTPAYTETLRPPLSWWLGAFGFSAAVWWAFAVASSALIAWCAALIAAGVAGGWLVRYGAVTVMVDEAGLRAGRARLPWRYVGTATACDAAETRRLLGTGADARAHLVIRPYVASAVQVAVNDERDPAPYWLISSRRPAEVAGCLNSAAVPD